MSVRQSIKNIYEGPFNHYLKVSEQFGGPIYEQNKLIEVLFLLQINLLDITQKYKKPVLEQEQNIFIDPIYIQIGKIKRIRDDNLSSAYILHLNLLSEAADIFQWVKETNVEEFVEQIKSNIAPHFNKLKNEILKLDPKHLTWVHSYNEWMEGLLGVLVEFCGEGLTWDGTEKLPTHLLGDSFEMYRKLDHIKLFQEINQGESITRILRQTYVNNEETQADE